MLDLAAWADERYRIPGDPIPSETDEDASDGTPRGSGR